MRNDVKVSFVGAGPGAADLLTLRGRDRLENCGFCLYAGSLVPKALLDYLPKEAERINSAPLTLKEIINHIERAVTRGLKIVRLHSGDPSIYGAIAEQMRLLRQLRISYEVVPGVNAFSAAAASLKTELTRPQICQTVALTRVGGKASEVRESLETLAKSGALLVIHLSVRRAAEIVERLVPILGEDCPAAAIYNASRADELVIRSPLAKLAVAVKKAKLTKTTLLFIGRSLEGGDFPDSGLYSPLHRHIQRPF